MAGEINNKTLSNPHFSQAWIFFKTYNILCVDCDSGIHQLTRPGITQQENLYMFNNLTQLLQTRPEFRESIIIYICDYGMKLFIHSLILSKTDICVQTWKAISILQNYGMQSKIHLSMCLAYEEYSFFGRYINARIRKYEWVYLIYQNLAHVKVIYWWYLPWWNENSKFGKLF